MNNKVVEFIEKHRMINKNDSIIVAFSGGADSVALLYLLHELRFDYDLKLSAVHINHMLRGAESDEDEAFCRNFCEKLDIPFFSERIDIATAAKASKTSIEEFAREARYKVLGKYVGDGKIATAHTLSDSVETTIFNLTRGTGVDGLNGIPPVRDNIIRPVLGCSREEIEEYCEKNNLDYRIDSTNAENQYSRNKIRNLVIPVLKEINSGVERSIGVAQGLLREDSDFLENLAVEKQGEVGTDKEKLLALDYVIARRVLKLLLIQRKLEISSRRINFIYTNLYDKRGKIQLGINKYLVFDEKYFDIVTINNEKPGYFEVSLEKRHLSQNWSKISLGFGREVELRTIECDEIENIIEKAPDDLKNLIDYDKIEVIFRLRGRKDGDEIAIAKRGVTKSLKKLFNEGKINREKRSELVIFESGEKIAWLEEYGVDESFSVNEKTKKAVVIRMIKPLYQKTL